MLIARYDFLLVFYVEPLSSNKLSTTTTISRTTPQNIQQVRAHLPTYAKNVAMPAFTAANPRCCVTGRAAIGRYLLPAGLLLAANPPHAAAAGEWDRQTDRWTDTVPFNRRCSAYYAINANKPVSLYATWLK